MKEADIMPYIYREYRAGQTVEVYKTYSARYGKHLPRGPNSNPTPEAVRKNNERIAEMKLRLLLNENFRKGDLFITLTYSEAPDISEAKKELARFIRAARAKYKAAGSDFAGLAAYLIKETKKTFREDNAPSRKRWNQSKNLRQPKEIVRVISAKRWAQEPKGRKGYVLITDSIVNDVSPFGIPYQHYRMVAVTEKRRN